MNQPNEAAALALHPIARLAASLIVHKPGAAPFLTEASIAQLEGEMATLLTQPDLREAVEQLVNLSMHLQLDKNAPEAARAILRVATLGAPAIQKRSDAANDQAERRAQQGYKMFFGEETSNELKPAPAEGIRLADLLPRNKIR